MGKRGRRVAANQSDDNAGMGLVIAWGRETERRIAQTHRERAVLDHHAAVRRARAEARKR